MDVKVLGGEVTVSTAGLATEAKQDTMITELTEISANTATLAGGSFAEDASVTTVAESFTAPADAVGFIIQAPSSNTANVRFKVGGTASSTSGFLLEPGRSETIMIGLNISYAAESGTQALYVQWLERA